MRPRINQKIQKFSIKRWLVLPVLMFISSLFLPIAIAQTTPPTANQNNATSIVTKAKLEYQSNKFESAAALWKQVAEIYAANGDKLNQAVALSNLSLTYQQIGKLDLATTSIEESLKTLEGLPDNSDRSKFLAQTYDIQGNLYREAGDSTKALETWKKATAIYQNINLPQALAQSRINQAQAMQDLGLYPLACQTVLANFNAKVPNTICRNLTRLNTEQLSQVLKSSELETGQYLVKLAAESPNITDATSLRSLANILEFDGRYVLSQKALETALAIATRLKSPSEQGSIYLSLGNIYKTQAMREEGLETGDRNAFDEFTKKAKESYGKAIEISPSNIVKKQARIDLIDIDIARVNAAIKREAAQPADKKSGEADKIRATLTPEIARLLQEAAQLPANRASIYLQVNLAENLLELQSARSEETTGLTAGELSEIDKLLANALSQADLTGDKRATAYVLLASSQLAQIQKDWFKAEEYSKQGLEVVSGSKTPEVNYRLYAQLGSVQAAKGEFEAARISYRRSVKILESLRTDLIAINPELQDSFRSRVEPIYRTSIALDFKAASALSETATNLKADNKEGKNDKNELLKGTRQLIESLQVAELNNFFRQLCETRTETKDIANIDQKAAVIYPVILDEGLKVLLSLPGDRYEVYSPQVAKDELNKTAIEVSEALSDRTLREADEQYKQLYDWLIKDLEPKLAESKIETLVFVPDGALRNVPMSVLYDGEKYLAEKYAIAVTPGLSLVNTSKLKDVRLNVASAGLSEVPQIPLPTSFPALPFVQKELENIEKLGLSGSPLLNSQFTSNKFQQKLANSNAPIIHLATHGQFSSQAENTFVVSWDRPINVRDLENLFGTQVLNRAEGIELLVLSACQTARGDRDNVRGALGLAGVAYRSGARSTVATLWQVSDNITAEFMSKFYTNLKQGKEKGLSRGEALRQAQTSLIKDSKLLGDLNRNLTANKEKAQTTIPPHFWAPYVLVGNWQ